MELTVTHPKAGGGTPHSQVILGSKARKEGSRTCSFSEVSLAFVAFVEHVEAVLGFHILGLHHLELGDGRREEFHLLGKERSPTSGGMGRGDPRTKWTLIGVVPIVRSMGCGMALDFM